MCVVLFGISVSSVRGFLFSSFCHTLSSPLLSSLLSSRAQKADGYVLEVILIYDALLKINLSPYCRYDPRPVLSLSLHLSRSVHFDLPFNPHRFPPVSLPRNQHARWSSPLISSTSNPVPVPFLSPPCPIYQKGVCLYIIYLLLSIYIE